VSLVASGSTDPSKFGWASGKAGARVGRFPNDPNSLWFTTAAASSTNPNLGDARLSFEQSATKVDDVWTILAKQERFGNGYAFAPFDTKKGGSYDIVDWVARDTHSTADLIEDKNNQNGSEVMMKRVFGFLLMWASLMMITRPIQELPELIPFIGDALSDAVECMLCCLTFFIAAFFAMFVIAISWLAARPLVGGALLLGCGACAYFFYTVLDKGKQNKQGARQPFGAPGTTETELSGAPVAAAAVAPAQQLVMVTCPEGTGGGQQVQVETPVGPRIVVVPQGVEPGQTFQVMV